MTGMTAAESELDLCKGRHFDREVIVLCVRWYLSFKLSSRDLVQMMDERGIALAHTTDGRRVYARSRAKQIGLKRGTRTCQLHLGSRESSEAFLPHSVNDAAVDAKPNDAKCKLCRAHEKCAQAGDDTIRGAQVGRTLAAAIEDQKLMPDQRRFGDN
jgi:hypothetical protein